MLYKVIDADRFAELVEEFLPDYYSTEGSKVIFNLLNSKDSDLEFIDKNFIKYDVRDEYFEYKDIQDYNESHDSEYHSVEEATEDREVFPFDGGFIVEGWE
jgi:hypothetical protein